MPKSKRDKRISLTQTKKKGLENKQKIVEKIHECVDIYKNIFTFSVQNMRNSKLKNVRQAWLHSRFHFGKNKVLAVALGRSAGNEYKDNLHKLSQHLIGQTGLLFTDRAKDDVLSWFEKYSELDYARSGHLSTQTVTIEEGPLELFSHSMEPQLRALGLPTQLQKGIIHLVKDHTICESGKVLTPEQARILKLFGYQMAMFSLKIESMWSSDGTYEFFDTPIMKPPSNDVTLKPADITQNLEAESKDGDEEMDNDSE